MRSNYKKLGQYIQSVNIKNKGLITEDLQGISMSKEFRKSTSNIIGTDLTNYRLVQKNQFACDFMSIIRVHKFPVVLHDQDHPIIVSPAYTVFEVIDENILNPQYLMMWLKRSEYDRYADFKCDSAIRGGFKWEELCESELPVPSIEKQREIVKEYHTIVDRIKLNEELNQKLEDAAQSIYKEWFVNFEFPDVNGKPYKSNGGEMVYCDELEMEIPKDWYRGTLSDIMEYSKDKINLSELNLNTYISTENMLENRGGVTIASSLPTVKSVSKFSQSNILISNIRPYFKKIWLSEFEGGCSNDILCIKSKNNNHLFLYFVLEQDNFFDYVMAGSKGTKMPRGDKDWILQYPIVVPKEKYLKKFSEITHYIKTNINIKKYSNSSLNKLKEVLLSKMATIEG